MTPIPRWPVTFARSTTHALLATSLVLCAACSSLGGPDIAQWRASELASVTVLALPQDELSAIEAQRAAGDLEGARARALALAHAVPTDAAVLLAASRAESDFLVYAKSRPKRDRDLSAASACEFAAQAHERAPQDGQVVAQHAWCMGATTHLQPMFERAAHARRVVQLADQALALGPQPVALATLALVHLRLETLPWIADVMAVGAPPSSLADAERFARSAVELVPCRENRLILAKVLVARDQRPAARAVLESALAAAPGHARDAALEGDVRALLEQLR